MCLEILWGQMETSRDRRYQRPTEKLRCECLVTVDVAILVEKQTIILSNKKRPSYVMCIFIFYFLSILCLLLDSDSGGTTGNEGESDPTKVLGHSESEVVAAP